MINLLTSLLVAEILRVRVLIAQPQQVADWYPSVVMEQVKERFKEDLGISLRVKYRKSYKVDHSQYAEGLHVYGEFYEYLRKVKRVKTWTKLVLVPAYWKDGVDYSAGVATWDLGLATMRQSAANGSDRFDYDWITASHELAHTVNAEHIDSRENLMNFGVLGFARPDLRFDAETKREVRRFLRERRG